MTCTSELLCVGVVERCPKVAAARFKSLLLVQQPCVLLGLLTKQKYVLLWLLLLLYVDHSLQNYSLLTIFAKLSSVLKTLYTL